MQYWHRNLITKKINAQCSSTATSTVAQSHQSSWPPTGEAEEAQIGGGRYRRPCGALGITGETFCRPEHQGDRRPAPEKMNCPASHDRSRRAGNWLLIGGKAAGGGERAGEVRNYLCSCLERAPDLGRIGGDRRSSSGCSGELQRLAVVGASSGRSSGAPRMIGWRFCSSSGRLSFLG